MCENASYDLSRDWDVQFREAICKTVLLEGPFLKCLEVTGSVLSFDTSLAEDGRNLDC